MSIVLDGAALPAPPPEIDPPDHPAVQHAERPDPGDFERLLRGLGSAVDRGERVMESAARGYASRDAAELIALQAGIYRYSEAVDLTAKLIDRATTAVRTVLQGGH